jgi:hypothetical protein
MKFRGTIFEGDQALLVGVFGAVTRQGAAGSWEGEFEVPAGAGIGPGRYHLLTDGGKSAAIEVVHQVDQGAGGARVAYFTCAGEPR